MVGRRKSKDGPLKGLSQRLKEDRISQLPECLLCEILNHLPTKQVVTTSILSTRWRSLWLSVSCLELETQNFSNLDAFASFGDRFLYSNIVSRIDKLTLMIDHENDASSLTSWVDASVKRKIQHLHVRTSVSNILKMPPSLYVCKTLVSLKLYRLKLASAEFVSLPCLRTMHLHCNKYPNEATFEKLISSSLVLEELEIFMVYNDAKMYRVKSLSLRRLCLLQYSLPFDYVVEVVIDAPLLCSLRIKESIKKIFIVNNLGSNAKLDIDLKFGLRDFNEASISSTRSCFRSFLPRISKVIDMTISVDTFGFIRQYSQLEPELEPLPQFGYMSRLCVTVHVSDLKWFEIFLQSCPNLKSLILAVHVGHYRRLYSEEINQISFPSVVPECLLSSLEFVDFKFSIKRCIEEMKLVSYFLKNSALLKKLTLRLASPSLEKDEVFKKIFKIPRASTKCEVVIL